MLAPEEKSTVHSHRIPSPIYLNKKIEKLFRNDVITISLPYSTAPPILPYSSPPQPSDIITIAILPPPPTLPPSPLASCTRHVFNKTRGWWKATSAHHLRETFWKFYWFTDNGKTGLLWPWCGGDVRRSWLRLDSWIFIIIKKNENKLKKF